MNAPADRHNTSEAAPGDAPPEGAPEGVPATDAARTLGELLNRVMYGRERIVITRHGRPVAELVPAQAT